MRDMMSVFCIGMSKEEIEKSLKEVGYATASKELFEEALENIWMDVQEAQN